MNVVPAQIAGVELDRRHLPAAARQRRAARPRRPRRLRAARGHRGVRASAARRPSPCSATAPAACEPVDMVTGPGNVYVDGGQAAAARADRHRLRGRPHRGRDPGRRHRRPGARRRRPDQPGRARPAGRRGAGHPQRGARRRRPRPGARAGGRDQALRPHPDGARRAASRASCWSTTSTPACRWSTPTPPSTWRSRPGTPTTWRCGCATPARSSSARGRRSRWATTARGPTTCCPPAGCARHSSGLSVQSFLRGVHVVEYDRDALAGVAGHIDVAGRRGGPAGARRRRAGPPACRDRLLDELPLRPELRGRTPYGAPQLDGHAPAQHQREPLPAARRAAGRPRDGAGRRRAATSTATPTGTPSRCAPAWPATSPAPAGRRWSPGRCGPPTAPTRSSSSCCRRSGAAGGRRWGSRRRTRCTRSSPRAPAPAGSTGTAGEDFTHRRRPPPSRRCAAAARRRLRDQPQQPDRHRRGARDDRGAARRGLREARRRAGRRRGVRRVRAARHPVGAHPAPRAGRGWWSAGR